VEVLLKIWYNIDMSTNRIWYSKNVDKDSPDLIHQTLMFGTLEEIKALKQSLGEVKIKELFLKFPKKIYTAPALNFIRNFILHLGVSINEQRYLKFTPRNIK